MTQQHAAGDPLPEGCVVMEVRVTELRQLFNLIDPSPFRERDLDPSAEEFIVGWAETVPAGRPVALLVHVSRPAGSGQEEEAAMLGDAIRDFFRHESDRARRRLRQLFQRGRISLVIALLFLSVMLGLGDVIARALDDSRLAGIVREGMLIGGWVAMWRPLEVFLYDWWPIRGEIRLYDRLAEMPVRVAHDGRMEDGGERGRGA